MATTTLRIDEALRERIARLAGALNQTPLNFMVEALAQKADEAEWKLSVQREAQQRDAALLAGEPGFVAARIDAIIEAIDILETSPLIGCPVAFGQRELVIATGASGYLAPYRYDPVQDTVFVLAVRSQCKRDYPSR